MKGIKIKLDTIARTIVLAMALINQVLAIVGKDALPFTEDNVYQICTLIATLVTSAIAWWKNNSFSQAALKADELKNQLKESKANK